MTKPSNVSCEMCAYGVMEKYPNGAIAIVCHRYPPRFHPETDDSYHSYTLPEDWCGEFQEEK